METITQSLQLVKEVNGQVTTTSLQVAEYFNKDHDKVLRAIRNLDLTDPFNAANFGVVDYTDAKGETRPMYTMTKDGFTLLAMGFTGKKATQFKISYISAFNVMEAKIKEQLQTKLTVPTYAETLRLYADALEAKEQLQANYEKALPKIAFHDQVHDSVNSITVGQFAKVLGTGQNRLFEWFKNNGYLITSQRPYQEYIDRGYFKVVEKTRKSNTTDESLTYFQVLITGKGQTYLAKKYKNRAPDIELYKML